MSFPDLNPIFEQLGLDPFARGLQIVDAQELAAEAFPRLDTDRPALIFRIQEAQSLAAVAKTLAINYPASHPVSLVKNKRVQTLTLDVLTPDVQISSHTILYLPPLSQPSSQLTLANIMARLRAPVGGCPWDLEQTHESITRALVEETYEVIEAISDNDMAHLKEELGDLQLHVLFQTQIARDQDEFRLSDVGAELAAKLIRRHPHVFGDVEANDAGTVITNWEKIKQEEKKGKGQKTTGNRLDAHLPRHLPALTRAQKISERARRKSTRTQNGKQHPANGDLNAKIARARDKERAVGESLLEIARAAEQYGIDAERALNAASKSFVEKNKE